MISPRAQTVDSLPNLVTCLLAVSEFCTWQFQKRTEAVSGREDDGVSDGDDDGG